MDNIQKQMAFVLCILFISLLRDINEKLSKFIATETALSKIGINSFIPLQVLENITRSLYVYMSYFPIAKQKARNSQPQISHSVIAMIVYIV